jgi:phosphoglycerol transferase MdoB-like AlkP superfamily enzyme
MVYFEMLKDKMATLQWIEENISIYFAGALFLFLIYLLFFTLFGNIYISTIITSIILIVIGLIHYYKLNFRMEPLYPSDIHQFTQLKDVIPMLKEYLSIKEAILIIAVLCLLLYLVRFMPKVKVSLWVRAILLALTVLMVYSYTFFPSTFMKNFVEKKANVSIVQWDQLENYKVNGFIFGFIYNLQNDAFDKPIGYSKNKVIATATKYRVQQSNLLNRKEVAKQPNIIYIMSEAFWDPTMLPNLQFSEDPMKNMRKLMEQYSSGTNLSPSFGAATANVEFEALTGFSNYFLREGSVPYQDLIDKKTFIPTIVSDLEGQGYRSMAIHPYNKVFYKRDKVYQTFGFDQFIDMDTMKYKEKAGPYISDESLSKEIIYQLKKQKQPLFIHAVSVQNHFDYALGRYEENTVSVTGLPSELQGKLETYAEGVKQADQALQLLVDNLEKLDEPTIVVFWGDHMPILGQDLAIYKKAKYGATKNKNLQEKEFSETPLLIYSNYGLKKQDLHSLSPAFFGTTVFDMAGLKKPPFYYFLDLVKEQLPGLKGKVQIDGDQKLVTGHLTQKQKQLLKDYELLEYDLLAGKQYSKDILFSK